MTTGLKISTAAAVACFCMMIGAYSARAAEITVLCSTAMKEVMLELIPTFERTSGHKLAISYESSNAILEKIKGGASADLVILTAETIADLARRGNVTAGSRVDLARSGVGLAVRSGAPKPDIGSVQALKTSLLAAKSIAYTKIGASGVHFAGVMKRLGIAEQMKSRTVLVTGSVGEVVAKGEAEIGVQQISELLPVAGIEIIGPLPGDLQKITVFSAGLYATAKEPEAAKALVRFLSAEAAVPVIRKKGMEPG